MQQQRLVSWDKCICHFMENLIILLLQLWKVCERDPTQNNTLSLWIRFWSKESPCTTSYLTFVFSSLTKNMPPNKKISTFSSFDHQTFLFLKFRWVLESFYEVCVVYRTDGSNPTDCYDFWSTCAANKLQIVQIVSTGSTRWRNKFLIVLVWHLTCIHSHCHIFQN